MPDTLEPTPLDDSPLPPPRPAVNWKRNLTFLWLSQFFSIAGFSFGMPFAPFFIEFDLGVTDGDAIKFWTGVFGALAALSLAIMSPVWGAVGDRYGRKLMLLRANFAGAVIVYLMGMVTGVGWLMVLRLLQGVFTGTVPAAQALVSVHTPDRRHGFALGSMVAAVYAGGMAGVFLGGVCAERFGCRTAFMIGGIMLLLAALVVVLAVEDRVEAPPVPENGNDAPTTMETLTAISARMAMPLGAALVVILVAAAFLRSFDSPMLPIFVKDQVLGGVREGAAMVTGELSAVGSIAAILSAVIIGRLADRMSLPGLGKLCVLGGGVAMFVTGFVTSLGPLFIARFATAFCSGGIDPILQVWLSRSTDKGNRGAGFGWATTARSFSWMLAPMASAGVAAWWDIRAVFWVGGILFFLMIPLFSWVHRAQPRSAPQTL